MALTIDVPVDIETQVRAEAALAGVGVGYGLDAAVPRRSHCLIFSLLCCSSKIMNRSAMSVSIPCQTPQDRRTNPDWR